MRGENVLPSKPGSMWHDRFDEATAPESKRVYKPALPHDEAFRIMTEGDGRTLPVHFDPEVLQAFVDLKEDFRAISEKWQDQ